MLGLQNEREWTVFCEKVLQQPELAADTRYTSNSQRSAARDELRRMIIEVFAQLTAAEVVQRLDDAQIANARVNDMHDVWDHAQLRARQRWREVESPAGSIPALLPPGSSQVADEPRRAWTPCRRSARTPTPSWPSWVARPRKSPSCARRTPFECSHVKRRMKGACRESRRSAISSFPAIVRSASTRR